MAIMTQDRQANALERIASVFEKIFEHMTAIPSAQPMPSDEPAPPSPDPEPAAPAEPPAEAPPSETN